MLGGRSLAEVCLKVAIENIHLINSLGGTMPPRYLHPILKVVKTAAQLHELEINSDDIYDESAEHWQRLIARDFRALSTQHNYAPQDRKAWHKVYDKYKKLEDEQIAAATAKLEQEFAAHDEHKHSRTSKIISGEKSGKLRPGKAKPGYAAPREKKTFIRKTMDQVRIEATRFNLRTPTGKLIVPPGQINKKVAESRLHEARIASLPSVPQPPPIRPPVKTADERDREKMEERLRRIKNSIENDAGNPQNFIAFSDDEDDTEPNDRSAGLKNMDDDDLFGDLESEDLFGDFEPKKRATSASSSSKALPVPRTTATQPGKRRRDAEEMTTESPAKRHRANEKTAAPASTPVTAAPRLPQPAHKVRRPKGLSAAPGANSALLARKPAPAQTSAKTTASWKSSLIPIGAKPALPPTSTKTVASKSSAAAAAAADEPTLPRTPTMKNTPLRHTFTTKVSDQPPSSDPPGSPVPSRHPLQRADVSCASAERSALYKSVSITPKKDDMTRRTPLHPRDPRMPMRRVQTLRPNVWPKRFMK